MSVIKSLRASGVNIKTILWWSGCNACPDGIFGQYAASYQAVANAFGVEKSGFP